MPTISLRCTTNREGNTLPTLFINSHWIRQSCPSCLLFNQFLCKTYQYNTHEGSHFQQAPSQTTKRLFNAPQIANITHHKLALLMSTSFSDKQVKLKSTHNAVNCLPTNAYSIKATPLLGYCSSTKTTSKPIIHRTVQLCTIRTQELLALAPPQQTFQWAMTPIKTQQHYRPPKIEARNPIQQRLKRIQQTAEHARNV